MELAIDLKTIIFIGLLGVAYWKYSEDIGALKKEIADMKEILKYQLSKDIKSLFNEDIGTLKKGLSAIMKQLSENLSALMNDLKTSIGAMKEESASIKGTLQDIRKELNDYKRMIFGILIKLSDQGQDQSGLQSKPAVPGFKQRLCNSLERFSTILQNLCLEIFT